MSSNKQQRNRQNKGREKSTFQRSGKSTTGSRTGKSDPRINLDNVRADKFLSDVVKQYDNSFRWYDHNHELIMSAGDIGFSSTTGEVINLTNSDQFRIPGIAAIYWKPELGDQLAVNQAKDSIYSYTVHENSRNTSYTAADQFAFIYAGKDVFSAIALGIRAYGLMRSYEGSNAYTPNGLLYASGFDPQDLRTNYSHMLFDINNLIAQSRQIWIPDTMPVIERQFWLNSNVYMDANATKAQFYIFAPRGYYTISETGSETGSSLVWTDWNTPSTRMKWSDYLTKVQAMIDALIASEDRGLIFGDILKAYKEEHIYRLNNISVDYQVVPAYDQEVLTQIENCTITNGCNNMNIVQTPDGGIAYSITSNVIQAATPSAFQTSFAAPYASFLNFHKQGQPTVEDVVIATRLKANRSYLYKISDKWAIRTDVVGTESVTNAQLFTLSNSQMTVFTFQDITTYGNFNMNQSMAWSMFDWAPQLLQTAANFSGDTPVGVLNPSINNVMMDLDNSIYLDAATLQRMHRACILSEWGVPVV